MTGVHPGYSDGYYFVFNEWGKVVLSCVEEEDFVYDRCLQQVIDNPRFFLDNLDYLKEFRVSWLNYGTKGYCKRNNRHFAISHPYRT
jgi:hypothetical protein